MSKLPQHIELGKNIDYISENTIVSKLLLHIELEKTLIISENTIVSKLPLHIELGKETLIISQIIQLCLSFLYTFFLSCRYTNPIHCLTHSFVTLL